jgi:hypothetical protein
MSTAQTAIIEVLRRCIADEENEEAKTLKGIKEVKDEHEQGELIASTHAIVDNLHILQSVLIRAREAQ